MRDVTDNRTAELPVGETKRGRGRPRKANALTNAERQAAYRVRRRNAVTVTKNSANPYKGKGSLEEAWRHGFRGERCLAHPDSNYERIWKEGQAARAGAGTFRGEVMHQDVGDLEDAMAELRAELVATKADLAEAHETIDEMTDELAPLRAIKARCEAEDGDLAALRRRVELAEEERSKAVAKVVQLVMKLDVAKRGVAKSVTRNDKSVPLYAEIKKSSKYHGQTEPGQLFAVSISCDGGEYVVQGGAGGQYRLRDVWLWAVDGERRKTRLN